ncbi:GDP-mannose 4,6-dehydratase [Hymenobacter caeli]|uniref:GDP-4-dehydro-6-deoxy-D-mannose reductase n=1 Tax=Hymenobacter caeli TaxID=2735894 RepID=A0ABX2FJH3_9BACT|nr:GDP-mannose 4,6-dehydratase [Hymenobacter caeli]NRT17266.1 GDP-4-dehydro-6-deoxy-D-mannose reductase [Hymenobacter caeli]
MKRILITGFTGFVSKYLLDHLADIEDNFTILGLSRSQHFDEFSIKNLTISVKKVDLNSQHQLKEILDKFRPEFIYHLASDSSVSYSWTSPIESFQNNTNIFLNLVESVRELNLRCRILSVGSSEEYGIVDLKNIPLLEDTPLNPVSPYAVARVSQELLSKVYVQGYGLDIVMTRSFNHIGPNQKDNFVISSFAKQIVKYKLGLVSGIEVGNINIIRDFLDVRDVVRAYTALVATGKEGEVYNICSNQGYSLKEVIDKMMLIAGIDCEYNVNANLIRPSDNPIIVGDNAKIKQQCKWEQLIPFDKTLSDIIDYWTFQLKAV